jgi:cysteinyl-tRNA synthetase
MNITDVWHLTWDNEWDANQWEDRMEKWARLEWLTAWSVAEKYAWLYFDDCAILDIPVTTDPTHWSSTNILMTYATDHIQEQISMIQSLEEKWLTYIIPDDWVYMDTSHVEQYWCLLCDDHLEGINAWARVASWLKKHPTDFALWKFNLTGKKRDMERDSPWWIWFPWRHIECSAMAIAYLWEQFDIHTWWMEHIPVHHTNEIAQSESSTWATPRVKYWFHYQWLMMNNQKIAKSTGNIATMDDVIAQWYTWNDMRFFYLQAHYRSFHDFTRDRLDAAAKSRKWLIKKIIEFYRQTQQPCVVQQYETIASNRYYNQMVTILCDDLATPQLISFIFDTIKSSPTQEFFDALVVLDSTVFWWWIVEAVKQWISNEPVHIPAEIQALWDARLAAKAAKNYQVADQLRDQAKEQGWLLSDTPDGQQISPIC